MPKSKSKVKTSIEKSTVTINELTEKFESSVNSSKCE